MMSAFQATIGGRFVPLATLVDEDADLDSKATHVNKAVTDIAAELLVLASKVGRGRLELPLRSLIFLTRDDN